MHLLTALVRSYDFDTMDEIPEDNVLVFVVSRRGRDAQAESDVCHLSRWLHMERVGFFWFYKAARGLT